MAVQIPPQAIADAKAGAGDLWQIVLAIAGPESGWDSQAKGDYKLAWGGPLVDRNTPGAFPTSFGYTQFHVDGGLGTGIPVDRLLNGVENFRLAAEHIRADMALGKSLAEALWPWSTRDAAWELYQRILSEGIAGVDGGSPPSGTPPAPGTSPTGTDAATVAAVALLLLLVAGV